jgi:hypothetical protein
MITPEQIEDIEEILTANHYYDEDGICPCGDPRYCPDAHKPGAPKADRWHGMYEEINAAHDQIILLMKEVTGDPNWQPRD